MRDEMVSVGLPRISISCYVLLICQARCRGLALLVNMESRIRLLQISWYVLPFSKQSNCTTSGSSPISTKLVCYLSQHDGTDVLDVTGKDHANSADQADVYGAALVANDFLGPLE
jgi:hypothetical protein